MHWHHLAIPITAILMPLFLVPITMTMRLRQRKREWEHMERMKSLELGLPAPFVSHGGGVAAIGAGVPMVALITALLTTVFVLESYGPARLFVNDGPLQGQVEFSIPALAIVWGCAATVSLFAMIFALVLGVIQARSISKTYASSNQWAGIHAKPAFDPEAYDFASHQS